jgi:hypothetical protein
MFDLLYYAHFALFLADRHALAELGGLGRGALAARTAASDAEIEVMHARSCHQCTLRHELAKRSFDCVLAHHSTSLVHLVDTSGKGRAKSTDGRQTQSRRGFPLNRVRRQVARCALSRA